MRRLAEDLAESGLPLDVEEAFSRLLLDEVDQALRPPVHERRVASSGVILEPASDPATWAAGTGLDITQAPLDHHPLDVARRFADGLSSWLLRRTDDRDEWLVFDRPAGSERDLVVLAEALGATIVQRHPAGAVRIVGGFGVMRWEGYRWHHEPPVSSWIDAVTACSSYGDPEVLEALLEFAVHDLGALGIGSLLVYRPDGEPGPWVEERLPTPLALDIRRPAHLAPLRHALSQVDGAAIFDAGGVLRRLGVRLVPSTGRRGHGRGARRHPPHVRTPLQPRRPAGHRHRRERGRTGVRPPQRCGPRPLARRLSPVRAAGAGGS